MASFFDRLRGRLGLGKGDGQIKKEESVEHAGAFASLSARFLACEDEAQKAEIWESLCRALPKTLFLASMCYEGEDPGAPVRDRVLHATPGARDLFVRRQHIVTRGNPGYRLSRKDDSRRMHLRTIVYNRTKEEWVPLFTDFNRLTPVFGKTARVTIISYKEACQIAAPYCGLVINPGKEAIRIPQSELKKAR